MCGLGGWGWTLRCVSVCGGEGLNLQVCEGVGKVLPAYVGG